MRGSPLVRAFWVWLAVVFLGWPLRSLTRPSGGKVEMGEEKAEPGRPVASDGRSAIRHVELELSFSRPAEWIELSHLGRTIWRKEKPGAREVQGLEIPFPREGVEFGVRVGWEGDSVSAVRFCLRTAEGEEMERSLWANGNLEAVVSFP